jgi:hypothetical protein
MLVVSIVMDGTLGQIYVKRIGHERVSQSKYCASDAKCSLVTLRHDFRKSSHSGNSFKNIFSHTSVHNVLRRSLCAANTMSLRTYTLQAVIESEATLRFRFVT